MIPLAKTPPTASAATAASTSRGDTAFLRLFEGAASPPGGARGGRGTASRVGRGGGRLRGAAPGGTAAVGRGRVAAGGWRRGRHRLGRRRFRGGAAGGVASRVGAPTSRQSRAGSTGWEALRVRPRPGAAAPVATVRSGSIIAAPVIPAGVARPKSPADGNRSSGSFSSARITASSSSGATPGRSALGGCGSSLACA